MKLTIHDYNRIADCLPRQRSNVTLDNLDVLNAILYVIENGCKWRTLPKEFGNWHSIYTRMNRWCKHGVLHRLFERLQRESMMQVQVTVMSLDSTIHPDGTGAEKKTARRPSGTPAAGGPPSFIWLPRMLDAPSSSVSRGGRRATRRGGASY